MVGHMNEERLAETLMLDEGFRGQPYLDTVGKVTIGFGRNLDDKPLTKAEAAVLLEHDIRDTVRDLDRRLSWWRNLDDVRQEVLGNMAFNLGINGLCAFVKMLAAARRGDFRAAAAEMRDSKWYRQVGGRAVRLAQQMETGTR